MSQSYHRCWAEIDCAALRQNAEAVRERIGAGELLAIVKANAYGHGMIGVAKALAEQTKLFGVANLEEATTLRRELPHPVMILGPALPSEREEIVHSGFIPCVSTLAEATEFNGLAHSTPVPVCFVVDTGMGRMGTPQQDALEAFRRIAALPNIKLHSVSTHLPVSNEDEQFTREELATFADLIERMRREVPGDYKAHVLQSAGVLAYAPPVFDYVRVGIMLYGISPLPQFQQFMKPVMTWKTRIGLIRDLPTGSSISYGRTFITPKPMRVATLTAGYADGYPRHLSNHGAHVLVRGQRCALLGRVTMDLIVVDVTDVPATEQGDEVVLMGKQGGAEIPCSELAERANTITWEITTRVGQRVRRVFV